MSSSEARKDYKTLFLLCLPAKAVRDIILHLSFSTYARTSAHLPDIRTDPRAERLRNRRYAEDIQPAFFRTVEVT